MSCSIIRVQILRNLLSTISGEHHHFGRNGGAWERCCAPFGWNDGLVSMVRAASDGYRDLVIGSYDLNHDPR
jgi:hypothetical protein